ncbi:MAG: hypothetical protein ABIE70_06375 [bacterium]
MSEATRTKVLMAVAAVVVVWGIFNFGGKSDKIGVQPGSSPTYAPPPEVVAVEPPVTGLDTDIDSIRALPWGEDPFRAAGRQSASTAQGEAAPPEWLLSGIIYNSANPMAVINSRPVAVGDIVNDARVVDIQRTAVVVENRGNRITLTVSKG